MRQDLCRRPGQIARSQGQDSTPRRGVAWSLGPVVVLALLALLRPPATARAVTGATISATTNPLVAQYTAPPCVAGEETIEYRPAADPTVTWGATAATPCQPGHALAFLVAGMHARTPYALRHVATDGGQVTASSPQTFTTGALPSALDFPSVTVPVSSQAGSDPSANLVIHMRAFTPPTVPNPLVADLAGHVVWYYDASTSGLSALWPVRFLPGGAVLLFGRTGQTPYPNNDDVVREIDLAGNTVHQTDLNAVNAQLTRRGQRLILGFHHDALRLPNGDTAVLGYTEACVDPQDNSLSAPPCAATARDVVGDEIVVLDPGFQNVVWTWDAFAQLDVTRKAVLGETCSNANPARFCPVANQNAEDWLHSNGLDDTPTDGNLILSIRHQDWVIKINYADGAGDGRVLCRLGPNGDFTLDPPYPVGWFSHQHNPSYLDATTLALFDNGNTRCTDAGGHYIAGCNSRGQVLQLDEVNHTATLVVNANLGVYSQAQGSAERLPNGAYAFGAGTLGQPPSFSQSIEVAPTASDQFVAPQGYVQQLGVIEYRSYRVADLYHGTPPLPAGADAHLALVRSSIALTVSVPAAPGAARSAPDVRIATTPNTPVTLTVTLTRPQLAVVRGGVHPVYTSIAQTLYRGVIHATTDGAGRVERTLQLPDAPTDVPVRGTLLVVATTPQATTARSRPLVLTPRHQ